MSTTVYVRRIPFDFTEEQLTDIFRSAGPVKDVRLIMDKNTGKSRGYAFVDFYDTETAASAVRNLDNYKVGQLNLQVTAAGGGNEERGDGEDITAIGHIASLINDMSQDEKVKLLNDFKQFILDSRSYALETLEESPQLAYALVQTMIDIGKIDQSRADTLLPKLPNENPQTRKRGQQRLKRRGGGTQKEDSPAPVQAPSRESESSPSVTPGPDPSVIRQVMSLSDAQISMLQPAQRQAVLDIRQKVLSGEYTV